MNVIDRARERIERGGWCRGGYGDYEGDGPVCVMGALKAVDRYRSLDGLALRTIADEIDDWGFTTVPEWNDDPATSYEDVILTLKRASVRLDEATR